MKHAIPRAAAALLSLLAWSTTSATEVRLLTIGNSFANNATAHLPAIVQASGKHTLVLGKANIGGCPLQRHWQTAQLFESDPTNRAGRAYGGRGMREWLVTNAWDVVTLQQFSMHSTNVATYRPYARQLADYVKLHAPGARILLHQTWAYRADDPLFSRGRTQEAMHRDARAAYHTIAGELGVGIIPVGEAFANAWRHPQWLFATDPNFDPKTAVHPALPDQAHSLWNGWQWRTEKDKPPALKYDGHHANIAGQYLGAAVFYEVLFGESVVGNPYTPGGLSREDTEFLQKIAHDTVADPANLEPSPAP